MCLQTILMTIWTKVLMTIWTKEEKRKGKGIKARVVQFHARLHLILVASLCVCSVLDCLFVVSCVFAFKFSSPFDLLLSLSVQSCDSSASLFFFRLQSFCFRILRCFSSSLDVLSTYLFVTRFHFLFSCCLILFASAFPCLESELLSC